MASIYDTFADSFAALAAKSKREPDKAYLLRLADQWRTVPADRLGPGRKPPAPATLASATENAAPLLARAAPQAPVWGPKSASYRIKDRKKQFESNPNRAKEGVLVRAREAIGVLRELEMDDDAILNELGLTADRAPKKAATDRSGRKLDALVSKKQNGFSSTARLAAHNARQARADERAAMLTPIVKSLQAAGVTSLNALTAALNSQGVPTPAGRGCWHPSQVARVLRRLAT
jgi:hypothetical protein